MGSESLFIKCKTCRKEVSKTAKACPHCGEKLKKLSAIHWVGVVFLALFVIGIINAPDQKAQSASSEPEAEVFGKPRLAKKVVMPADQDYFILTVEKYVAGFRQAKNELQQSALRDQRKNEISKIISERAVSSWVGRINKLETNTEGKAILSIRISPDIEVKTWNNAFSDINASTLISKDSSLYNNLFELSRGQRVEFSGSFFSSQADYVEETSMTIQGSMTNPEFLFKFKSVKPLD